MNGIDLINMQTAIAMWFLIILSMDKEILHIYE